MHGKSSLNFYNEIVMAVDFKPNPRVLDCRGEIAKQVSSSLALREWQITENQVDIFSLDKKRILQQATLSFKRLAFFAVDCQTNSFFNERLRKFINSIKQFEGFDGSLEVTRIGVMSKFYNDVDMDFQQLLGKYIANYVCIHEDTRAAIGENARIVDIGLPLNFQDDIGSFNTSAGPMKNEELKTHFRDPHSYPSVGFFFLCEYFKEHSATMHMNEIVEFITTGSMRAWEKNKKALALIKK